MRIPNVFTAIADVLMGFLFVQHRFEPAATLVVLVATSCLLYTAGMVLNDLFDIEVDLRERPERPLPSGRISLGRARLVGFGMLAAGVVAGWTAGFVPTGTSAIAWRSGVVATSLAAGVLLYDGFLKKTPLGPLGMGCCRFLNVLLGMSAGAPTAGEALIVGYGPHHLAAAGGIGVYIVGVTLFARSEAEESSRVQLFCGFCVMAAGICLLAAFPWFWPEPFPFTLDPGTMWLLLLAMISVTIVRRCLTAVASPTPGMVQAAVKHCIFSLIFLDAAAGLQVSTPFHAIAILLLLLPTLALGRWVYST